MLAEGKTFPAKVVPDCPNTAVLLVPLMPTVTLPPDDTTLTFDVPLEMLLRLMPVTPMVMLLAVLLPTMEMLSPAVSVSAALTALATTAVPLANTLPKARL